MVPVTTEALPVKVKAGKRITVYRGPYGWRAVFHGNDAVVKLFGTENVATGHTNSVDFEALKAELLKLHPGHEIVEVQDESYVGRDEDPPMFEDVFAEVEKRHPGAALAVVAAGRPAETGKVDVPLGQILAEIQRIVPGGLVQMKNADGKTVTVLVRDLMDRVVLLNPAAMVRMKEDTVTPTPIPLEDAMTSDEVLTGVHVVATPVVEKVVTHRKPA